MSKTSTTAAGIDIAKEHLDIAVHGCGQNWRVANAPEGFADLVRLMRAHQVGRIGLEATGGYERDVVAHLRAEGFTVIVLQPRQVRAYAQLTLRRAKTDRIDATLIAALTADHAIVREAPDPRLAALAERLTWLEQIEEDIARIKVRLEHIRDSETRRISQADLARLTQRRANTIAKLLIALRRHDDLATRLKLVLSVAGIGPRTAIALLIRMPELGRLSRGEAAALAGLAPFNNDSGKRGRQRSIAGGRTRLRTSLYAAALPAAFRWNEALKRLYTRLKAAGKPHKLALVACARKLLAYANTVLARGTPWLSATTNA
ncbi:MAG TPA: IS110 family transposase [Hyphomicrobium sp.]|nr:IS110 family transposase [Hyphomicrobium sp.]